MLGSLLYGIKAVSSANVEVVKLFAGKSDERIVCSSEPKTSLCGILVLISHRLVTSVLTRTWKNLLSITVFIMNYMTQEASVYGRCNITMAFCDANSDCLDVNSFKFRIFIMSKRLGKLSHRHCNYGILYKFCIFLLQKETLLDMSSIYCCRTAFK